VATKTSPRTSHDVGGCFGRCTHVARAERQAEFFAQRSFAIRRGLGHHLHHPNVAFDLRGPPRVACAVRCTRNEVGKHCLFDAGFPETRQHALDVAQKDAVRADDENALVFQWKAVRVKKVCRSVQGNDGLSGSRTALNDKDTRLRRADDLVLFALDGRNDVAQLTRATSLERRQQRAVTAQAR
jgi:hypothetical protein